MGEITPHRPVLLLLAVISRYDDAIRWAAAKAQTRWGPVALESEPFCFDQTEFYRPTMGDGLKKKFLVFERLIDPSDLVAIKHQTNRWEEDYAASAQFDVSRPLNLDPGYLSEAKLVLATTKDRDHRLYMDDGIYCEGTLYFQSGEWRAREWTYPDYRCDAYYRFFQRCRSYLRSRYRQPPEASADDMT